MRLFILIAISFLSTAGSSLPWESFSPEWRKFVLPAPLSKLQLENLVARTNQVYPDNKLSAACNAFIDWTGEGGDYTGHGLGAFGKTMLASILQNKDVFFADGKPFERTSHDPNRLITLGNAKLIPELEVCPNFNALPDDESKALVLVWSNTILAHLESSCRPANPAGGLYSLDNRVCPHFQNGATNVSCAIHMQYDQMQTYHAMLAEEDTYWGPLRIGHPKHMLYVRIMRAFPLCQPAQMAARLFPSRKA